VQTTLLGLAIAFIIALVAALVGPYFIDWNQFRPQFEAEATRIIGAPVRVGGKLDARLLPTPSLQLRSVVVGGTNDLGKVRAAKLDVEFSLGSLMRGEWRATELTINGMSLDLGFDPKGRIDWPASTGPFNLGSVAIDRLNLTGRVALHDAASHGTIELSDIAFSGDVRSLAGSIRGDGNFMLSGVHYPFRISSGQGPDGNGTRVHLNIDPGQRPLAADLDGLLSFEARAPRFDGAMTLAEQKRTGDGASSPPWRIAAKVKADTSAARLEAIEVSYGAEERALKLSGNGDIRFGASPLLHASLSARQLDADRFAAKDSKDGKGQEGPFSSLQFSGNKGPINIKSDTLDLDYKGNVVVFRGHVHAVQADALLTSDTLTVSYLKDFREVKNMVANGNVRMSQGTRFATGDHGVLDQAKHTVTLTGNPVVHDGDDQVSGTKITVHLDTGKSEVEGARAVFFPKEQKTRDNKTAAANPS